MLNLTQYYEKTITRMQADICRLIEEKVPLLTELTAYHDLEWARIGHGDVPCHKAGELPDRCSACQIIKKAKGEGK